METKKVGPSFHSGQGFPAIMPEVAPPKAGKQGGGQGTVTEPVDYAIICIRTMKNKGLIADV